MSNTAHSPSVDFRGIFAKVEDAVGGVAKIKTAFGITKQAVNRWRHAGIPAARVLDVERISGIAREVLRPDIFTREDV